ncbi:hypothetical protein BEN78_05780 [Xanthomonas citri pv. mangiferaeindicae]|nr:hypothetical protein BEN78_05780 [Xanthomonas citri pv. mangiferaeindicae]
MCRPPHARLLPRLLACAWIAIGPVATYAAPPVVFVDAPVAAPRTITLVGQVTGAFGDGLGGWFLQTDKPERGLPPAVFVDARGHDDAPAAGAHVRVAGALTNVDGVPTLQPSRIEVLTTPAPRLAPLVLTSPPNDWAALAGRWVRIDAPLTLTGQHDRARRGTLIASFDGRLYSPTEIAWPGRDAAMVQAANALNRVLLDDGRDAAPDAGLPWYLPAHAQALRTGSVLTGVEGIVDHRDGAWRLQLTAPLQAQPAPRPPAPMVEGDVRLAAFNLENLFNGDGRGGGFPTPRGARAPAELARQIDGLVSTISALDVDVAALMELENDGYDAYSSIAQLVDALNAAGPARDWRFVDTGTGPGTNPVRVGLIYRNTRVRPKGAPAMLEGGPFVELSRVPLAQAFVPLRDGRADGADFSVVAVHLKSKGCRDAAGADTDGGDGQACWKATRTESAQRLRDWLATAPTPAAERIAVVGDFNAYAMEDPVRVFIDAGWRDPFARAEPPAHSFVFDGQAGRLDHVMLSPALATRLAGAAKWHSNADEPVDIREREANGPWRSSDHDPLVIGLRLRAH